MKLRLIGYSSDDIIDEFLLATKHYENIAFPEKLKVFGNNKKAKNHYYIPDKVVKLREVKYFAYLIKGEKHLWKVYKDFSDEVKKKHNIIYLGIQYAPPLKNPEWAKCPPKNKIISWSNFFCCYCETPLDEDNYTREHIVPRSRGGRDWMRNMLPCCNNCNTEKDNLMLHSYIQYLNLKMDDMDVDSLEHHMNMIKIKNANKIALKINTP